MSTSRIFPLLLLAGGGYYLLNRAKAQATAIAAAQAAVQAQNQTVPGLGRFGFSSVAKRAVQANTKLMHSAAALNRIPAHANTRVMRVVSHLDAKAAQANTTTRQAAVSGLGAWTMSKSSIESIGREALIAAIPIVGPSLVIKHVAQNMKLPPAIKKVVVAGATMSIPIVGSAMVTQGAFASRGRSIVGSSNTSVTGKTSSSMVPMPPASIVTQSQYFDAQGNQITEAQYNADMAAGITTDVAIPVPTGVNLQTDAPAPQYQAPQQGGSKLPLFIGGAAALVGGFFMLKH